MARTDQDAWDAASSVGATATMVAAVRALASEEADSIINDPFAAPLVRAVGLDFFRRLVDGDIPFEAYEGSLKDMALETDSIAVRTRFFDDFFLNAASHGVHQSVILAAGLDARAYRLAWPAGSVVYEVDQPKVIQFKSAAMSNLGATPVADRRTVGIDLREDWPTALRRSGFNVTQPTSWSTEGLLMYLPPEAQDRLFDDITELSVPGSKLATEYHPAPGPTMTQRAQEFNDRWAKLGCDIDFSGLFFEGERRNVVDYLTDRCWQVTVRKRRDLFGDYGLPYRNDDETVRNIETVVATRR